MPIEWSFKMEIQVCIPPLALSNSGSRVSSQLGICQAPRAYVDAIYSILLIFSFPGYFIGLKKIAGSYRYYILILNKLIIQNHAFLSFIAVFPQTVSLQFHRFYSFGSYIYPYIHEKNIHLSDYLPFAPCFYCARITSARQL
jgi:hypothetical protein